MDKEQMLSKYGLRKEKGVQFYPLNSHHFRWKRPLNNQVRKKKGTNKRNRMERCGCLVNSPRTLLRSK